MKIKYVNVFDEGTEMKFLLLQAEECDLDFFKNTGIRPGYKIVIQISGGVAAAGGFEFIPEHGSSLHQLSSTIISRSGTTNALGLFLNSVDNIKSLPDCIDVDNLRNSWLALKSKYRTIKTKLDELYEEEVLNDEQDFRKVLYKKKYLSGIETAVVNQNLESLWSTSSTNQNSQIADFLWIPFDEVNDDEWVEFVRVNELFGVERIRPI